MFIFIGFETLTIDHQSQFLEYLGRQQAQNLDSHELLHYSIASNSTRVVLIGTVLMLSALGLLWTKSLSVSCIVLASYSGYQLLLTEATNYPTQIHSITATLTFCFIYYIQQNSKASRLQGQLDTYYRPQNHRSNVIAAFAIYFAIGGMLYDVGQKQDATLYASNQSQHPIQGQWEIANIDFKTRSNETAQKELLELKSLILLEEGNFGIANEDNIMSFFEYEIDSNAQELKLTNFDDYETIDLKGKYQSISNDTIFFKGINAQDSISFTLVYQAE